MALINADTTFLIDLSREFGKKTGPVRGFLHDHASDEFAISVTALGEFAAGFADLRETAFVVLKSRFKVLPFEEEEAWRYREIFRFLKARGQLMGANDLWIAAAALRNNAPLVTRNSQEFLRVPGLKVLTY
jgi:tRNA(fMet)-specific endonuclease VapC